jgi:glutamate carboxypeptidase
VGRTGDDDGIPGDATSPAELTVSGSQDAGSSDASLITRLRGRADEMIQRLHALVAAESPSPEVEAMRRCVDLVAETGQELLGAPPERLRTDGRTHLRWRLGDPPGTDGGRVAIIGHLDTVWPLGTVERWPFERRDDRTATGPGVFDMKGGLIQAFVGLSELARLDGVEVLVTSDEEIGSPTSRDLVRETASRVGAVLVPEPSGHEGAVKVARKGVAAYRVRVHGRASHAGLEPEAGVNALVELAGVVPQLAALSDPGRGTTVTPTVAEAGSAVNVVPAEAWVKLDVRARSGDELRRVDQAVRALEGGREGARLEVSGGENRPPLPRSAAEPLVRRLEQVVGGLGLPVPDAVEVGGGSDANYAAEEGALTLDGLGAVGGGAHAEGEWIDLRAMPERAAILAGLVADLLARPVTR